MRIKFRVFIGLLCVLLLADVVLGLDCECTAIEFYEEPKLALCPEDSKINCIEPLQISDFTSGDHSTFTIFNPNPVELYAKFTFHVTGHTEGEYAKGVKLSSNEYSLLKHYCYDNNVLGNCSINSNISYFIAQPIIMNIKEISVTKNRTICAKRDNGELYKNKGEHCAFNTDCCSGICNFAKVCSDEISSVICPEGTLNCNNQSCLKPSVKSAGEAYSCVWECETGKGNKNICSRHWTDYIIIISVFLAFIVLLIKRIRETITGKDIEKLKNELRNLNAIMETKKNQLEKLEQQKNKTEEDKRKITELTKQVDEDTKKYKEAINKNEKVLEEYTKERKSPILGAGVYEWKNPRKEFYPCYVNQGIKTDKLIHKYIAKTKIFNVYSEFFNQYYPNITFDNLRVHHIDRDIDNYRVNNLVIISQKEHDDVKHSNIHDYASGIAELKRVKIKAPNIPELNKNANYQEQLQLIKDKHPRAYEPWDQEEENTLKKLYNEKESIENIANALKRQPSAIHARLKKIGLIE